MDEYTRQFKIADFKVGGSEWTNNTCSALIGSVRFVDPENGNDANDGRTPDTPWKTEREWEGPERGFLGLYSNRFCYKMVGTDTWEPFDCGLGEHGEGMQR